MFISRSPHSHAHGREYDDIGLLSLFAGRQVPSYAGAGLGGSIKQQSRSQGKEFRFAQHHGSAGVDTMPSTYEVCRQREGSGE